MLHSTLNESPLLRIIKLWDIWIICPGRFGTDGYQVHSQDDYFEEDTIHWNVIRFVCLFKH